MRKKCLILNTLLLLILLVTILTGCDPGNFYFDYDDLKTGVEKIELIYYDSPGAKEHFDAPMAKALPFDFEKEEVLETLPKEKHDVFLKRLSEKLILTHWWYHDEPNGESIKITYKNKDFIIISGYSKFVCEYYANGEIKEFIGACDYRQEVLIFFWEELKLNN